MIATGARGFAEKRSSGQILLRAIREVGNGNTFFSTAIARRLARMGAMTGAQDGRWTDSRRQLTHREQEVLQFVADRRGRSCT
jgi:DNA-binding NarL/FixJ family response regulator